MKLKLGNFRYEGERFYIDDKPLKLSPMRYKILKLLADNYNIKPVKFSTFMQELYYDNDDIRDEPMAESFKAILHQIRKILIKHTDNRVCIVNSSGKGYSLDFNNNTKVREHIKIKHADKAKIVKLHNLGHSAESISSQFGVKRHKIFDLLIRSKQDKTKEQIEGASNVE